MDDIIKILESTKLPSNVGARKGNFRRGKKSIVMGYVKRLFTKDAPIRLSNFTQSNPELYTKLVSLMKQYDPDFQFNQIMINKNIVTPPHRDKYNRGDSYIIFFGDYKGGELVVGDRTIRERYKFHKFNGKEEHYNLPITEGVKYSVIYYTSTRLPPEVLC